MGFGPGWRFDEKQLTDDYAYSQLEAPVAHLKVHAERSFRSGDALNNFKPLLGRDQSQHSKLPSKHVKHKLISPVWNVATWKNDGELRCTSAS